jgi:hypothetical protein
MRGGTARLEFSGCAAMCWPCYQRAHRCGMCWTRVGPTDVLTSCDTRSCRLDRAPSRGPPRGGETTFRGHYRHQRVEDTRQTWEALFLSWTKTFVRFCRVSKKKSQKYLITSYLNLIPKFFLLNHFNSPLIIFKVLVFLEPVFKVYHIKCVRFQFKIASCLS